MLASVVQVLVLEIGSLTLFWVHKVFSRSTLTDARESQQKPLIADFFVGYALILVPSIFGTLLQVLSSLLEAKAHFSTP